MKVKQLDIIFTLLVMFANLLAFFIIPYSKWRNMFSLNYILGALINYNFKPTNFNGKLISLGIIIMYILLSVYVLKNIQRLKFKVIFFIILLILSLPVINGNGM